MIGFSKYHGTGNDFVLLADPHDELELPSGIVAELCRRRTGIGADGLIRLTGEAGGDTYFMDYRNADGSIAELCGNGIRCAAAFLHDRGLTADTELTIDTRAGRRKAWLHFDDMHRLIDVTVDMGPPSFERAAIPMTGSKQDRFLAQPLALENGNAHWGPFKASAVSMGNPHVVLFLEEPASDELVASAGPAIERHPWFPEHTNVEFVAPGPNGELQARVWERGVGETLACGTGACAVFAAAREAGIFQNKGTVRFPGGELSMENGADGHLLLTGPVVHVFDGELEL